MYPADYLTPEYQWLAPLFEEAKPVVGWKVGLVRLALGAWTDAKRVDMEGDEEYWRAMVRVLDDRRPTWAGQWVEHWLAREKWWEFVYWPPIRELVARGICEKPALDNYYHVLGRGLIWDHWKKAFAESAHYDTYRSSDYLRDNPDLLEDVYGVLRVGSYALASPDDPWADTDREGDEPLAHAFRSLAEEGLLDRGRLLRASLKGLNGGHAAQILSRLANFHEGMEPSNDELAALQPAYCSLLSGESDRVAAFAVKMLKKVDQAKALDDAAYVEAAIPLLDRKGKGLVKSVLALFQKIAKRTPPLRPTILGAVVERGLLHPDGDIQEVSLKLLETCPDDLDERMRAAIGEHVAEIATTLQDRARALAGVDHRVQEKNHASKAREKTARLELQDLPGPWRSLSGVDAALAALEAGHMPPPLSPDTGNVPVLTGLNPLSPLETLDDVMALAGRQLDQALSAIEMEQLLGAISETDPNSDENFDRLTAPLLKRMECPREELGHLLYTWLARGKAHEHFDEELPTVGYRGGAFWLFQHHRIREVRERVLKGAFAPLLATPTHEGGWLAASALVARLGALGELGVAPDRLDFIQALLRLAPDGREAAALSLPSGKDPYLRATRWVLTGEGKAEAKDDPDLWLAAARARCPRARVDVPGLRAEGLVGPDGEEPATYGWISEEEIAAIKTAEAEVRAIADEELEKALESLDRSSMEALDLMLNAPDLVEERIPGGGWLHRPLREDFGVKVTPPWVHRGDHLGRPTVMLHAFPNGGPTMHRERYEFEWTTMIWPHNRDALYAAALLYITEAYTRSSSKKWPAAACLDPILEPDQPITLPAAMLLSFALFAPEGDLSRTAVDVLIESIADGRLHPDQFAEALPRLCTTKYFQPGRMAKYLAEVAQVSPLHAWTVAGMLQPVLGSWETLPQNAHHVLALLLELLAQLGEPLNAPAAEALGQLKCSGKSAKLAKQLLALARVDNGAMAEARAMALEAHIARAERWAGAHADA